MRENILNIRRKLLKHQGLADRYHTAWSLLETFSNTITIVFLLLALASIVIAILTGYFSPIVLVWLGGGVAWLVVQFLINLTIEAVRTRQRIHEFEACHYKLKLENMGLDPDIF